MRNPMLAQKAAAPVTPPAQPIAPPAKPSADTDRGPITLAQFLKLIGAAENGGHAKALVREGQVTVNGQAEDRPGRKLAKGDRVSLAGADHTVDR